MLIRKSRKKGLWHCPQVCIKVVKENPKVCLCRCFRGATTFSLNGTLPKGTMENVTQQNELCFLPCLNAAYVIFHLGSILQNFLRQQFTNVPNKLECWSLASLLRPSLMFVSKANLPEYLKGTPLKGSLLALPTNGWKGLPVKNTLA